MRGVLPRLWPFGLKRLIGRMLLLLSYDGGIAFFLFFFPV